jgi:hypothetical protein
VLSADSIGSENTAKLQNRRRPLTLIQMDNASVHTTRTTQEKLDFSRFKRTPQPPDSQDIAPSDFFFSVG